MSDGPNFFDNADVFDTYTRHRQRAENPNDTVEKPIFMEMLGDVHEKAILDLGCGDGAFGVELLAMGCQSYTGIEASARMADVAEANLTPVGGIVHRVFIEDWIYPDAAFDLVISRLALHYISDFPQTLQKVHSTLRPGGRFIFSVEHPVLTSCNLSAMDSGIRRDWIVDDYFITGARDVAWLGGRVVKYHRTIEDYFGGLQASKFVVEQLRESRPRPEMFVDEALYRRRTRIPLFLLLAARRE